MACANHNIPRDFKSPLCLITSWQIDQYIGLFLYWEANVLVQLAENQPRLPNFFMSPFRPQPVCWRTQWQNCQKIVTYGIVQKLINLKQRFADFPMLSLTQVYQFLAIIVNKLQKFTLRTSSKVNKLWKTSPMGMSYCVKNVIYFQEQP